MLLVLELLVESLSQVVLVDGQRVVGGRSELLAAIQRNLMGKCVLQDLGMVVEIFDTHYPVRAKK